MTLNLELDAEFAEVLAEEAARRGLSLNEYALKLLNAGRPPVSAMPWLRTGADIVAYWEANGLIGTRPDITDPEAHSQALRERSNSRQREEPACSPSTPTS